MFGVGCVWLHPNRKPHWLTPLELRAAPFTGYLRAKRTLYSQFIERFLHPQGNIYVVISDRINGKVLTVNFTNESNIDDDSCKLTGVYYPVLTKTFVIFYNKVFEMDALTLD